jgi:NitT/TauT family transport system substrate-binding protein
MQKKWLIGGVVAILMVLVIFVITKNSSAPGGVSTVQNPKFRMSFVTWVGYAPFWLAQDKGFFKDEGVNVDINIIEDTAQYRAALKSGSLDGIGDTADSTVLARSQGVPAVIVGQVDFSDGADGIVAIDSIKSVKDLKGKTIAVQRNFVSESWLNYVLIQNGINPNEVNLLDTEAGAAGAAFAAGKVDVAVTWEPWLSKAKERKGGHLLISSHDIPGVVTDVISMREDYVKENPDAVKKVLRAYYRAVEYWKTNPKEADEIMAKHYNESATDFADQASGLVWPTGAEAKVLFGTADKPGKIYGTAQTFSDIFVKTGQITGNAPDVRNAIDGSFLNELF